VSEPKHIYHPDLLNLNSHPRQVPMRCPITRWRSHDTIAARESLYENLPDFLNQVNG
jgi:hypothetical protein